MYIKYVLQARKVCNHRHKRHRPRYETIKKQAIARNLREYKSTLTHTCKPMDKYNPPQHAIHRNQPKRQNIIGTFLALIKQAILQYCQPPKEETMKIHRTCRKLHTQHSKALGQYLLTSITKNTTSQNMHWLVHRYKLYNKPKIANSHAKPMTPPHAALLKRDHTHRSTHINNQPDK